MGAQGLLAVGVPPQPLWLLYIKIAILVLSLIVLALGAYSESLLWGAGGPGAMAIFVAIWSFIVYGGGAALEIWAPHLYYRIALVVGQGLAIVFWLSAWAWSANVASVWLRYIGSKSFGGSLAGCAALGAVAWVLTIVHLVFFVRAAITEANPSGAELGKVEATAGLPQQQPQYPAQQPYPAQAPQPYPAQQYPVQQPGPYQQQ